MSDASKSPLTFGNVLVLSSCYLLILVASVMVGYLLGIALLGVAIALNYKVLFGLLKRYLWDQWLIINAETMDRAYLGPQTRGAQARAKPAKAARSSRKKGRKGRKGGKSAAASVAGSGAGSGAGPGAGSGAVAGVAGVPDTAGWKLDWRPLVILVFVAVVLTLLEYWGSRRIYNENLPVYFPHVEGRWFRELGVSAFGAEYQRLGEYVYWVGFRVVFFFVLPALFIVWLPGERLREYGLSFKGFFKHLPIYGILFLIVLPAVIAVSFTDSFASHYPFYKPWQNLLHPRGLFWHDFLIWEVLYMLQFFSLEFFFRGFMLHALKRSLGAYAVFVMAVPYCMIHFGKPMPETLGAVAAGVVLGTLALRTGSIWAGVMIHVSVAWTMDWLALIQTGRFPKTW
jgi:membrane protease YdiL (CAAX protease family)